MLLKIEFKKKIGTNRNMFETTDDINTKYNCNYNSRPLTSFEKNIINSAEKVNLKSFDLTNIEVLESLSLYYDIENIKNPSSENENLYLCMLLKLSKFGSPKGALRLGIYYLKNKNYTKSLEYFQESADQGCPEAYLNLYILQKKINPDVEGDLNLLISSLKLGYIPSINCIVNHFIQNRNFIEALKYAEYGLYKELDLCMTVFVRIFNSTQLYEYFLKLSFTNSLIEKTKTKIYLSVSQDEIDSSRNMPLIIEIMEKWIFVPNSSKELIDLYG